MDEMSVKELLGALRKMPKNAEVWHLWDGEPRTMINVVYLSKDGRVITADHGMNCYTTEARPVEAPNEKEEPYWKTNETRD